MGMHQRPYSLELVVAVATYDLASHHRGDTDGSVDALPPGEPLHDIGLRDDADHPSRCIADYDDIRAGVQKTGCFGERSILVHTHEAIARLVDQVSYKSHRLLPPKAIPRPGHPASTATIIADCAIPITGQVAFTALRSCPASNRSGTRSVFQA
jgi:hypothetical protein